MNFDLAQARRRLDPDDMYEAVSSLGDHLREAWSKSAAFDPDDRAADFDRVLILGMGGSAIGGDLLAALARTEASIPITVCRDYEAPAWVGPSTLVIASSYSGSTEETLASLADARERGATVYAVASGGDLLAIARDHGLPHLTLPGGMQPRAAIAHSLAALLRIGDRLGLYATSDADLEATAAALDSGASSSAQPADEIAATLEGRLTLVYTGPGLLAPVGVRWRNQIQENAKQPAFGNVFPELNHNEIMGWEGAPADTRDRVAVIVLRDPDDHPQVARRIDLTRELLRDRLGAWHEHEAPRASRLTRMLSVLQLGDFVSVHLAFRSSVDPTPVATIERLKRALVQD